MTIPIIEGDREFISAARKEEGLRRLSRIEGQVKGVKKMISEGRPCVEVLTQMASVQAALRGMTKLMMRNYLENCATQAIRSKAGDEIYDELMNVIFKFSK